MNPLISVIVPCYNQAQYLDECLQSVLDQTYQNWECIIVNDGSPDNTEEIAKNWVDKDNRFKYFYKENGGLSSARNFGINLAKGEWIQFLDCDDFLDVNKFEICIKRNVKKSYNLIIHQYLDYKCGIANSTYYDLSKVDFSFKGIVLEWDVSFAIPIHCALLRRKLIKGISFNETLKAKEDWHFWIEIFKKEVSLLFINENLCYYRNQIESITKNEEIMLSNQRKAIRIVYDSLDQDMKDQLLEKIFILNDRDIKNKNLKIKNQHNDFNILVNSRTFRLGNFLLAPFRILKR